MCSSVCNQGYRDKIQEVAKGRDVPEPALQEPLVLSDGFVMWRRGTIVTVTRECARFEAPTRGDGQLIECPLQGRQCGVDVVSAAQGDDESLARATAR